MAPWHLASLLIAVVFAAADARQLHLDGAGTAHGIRPHRLRQLSQDRDESCEGKKFCAKAEARFDGGAGAAVGVAVFVLFAIGITITICCCRRRSKRMRQKGDANAVAMGRVAEGSGLASVINLARTRMGILSGGAEVGNSAPGVVPPSGRYAGTANIDGEEKSAVYDQLLFSDEGIVQGTRQHGGHTFKILGIYDSHAKVYRWAETVEGHLLYSQDAAGSVMLQDAESFVSAVTEGREFVLEAVMAYTGKRLGGNGAEQPARFIGELHTSSGETGNLELLQDVQPPWGGKPGSKNIVTV